MDGACRRRVQEVEELEEKKLEAERIQSDHEYQLQQQQIIDNARRAEQLRKQNESSSSSTRS
jgi:hypothetical protein